MRWHSVIQHRSLTETFSIGDCVFGMHNSTYADNRVVPPEIMRMSGHYQRRITIIGRDKQVELLNSIRLQLECHRDIFNEDIKASGRKPYNFSSFEEFYATVLEQIFSIPRITGVGTLTVSDIALRLSAHYCKGLSPIGIILPSAWVYLHAGALRGSISLVGKETIKRYRDPHAPILPNKQKIVRVPRYIFPQEFQALTSYQIEDILCIYHSKLQMHCPVSLPFTPLTPKTSRLQVFPCTPITLSSTNYTNQTNQHTSLQ